MNYGYLNKGIMDISSEIRNKIQDRFIQAHIDYIHATGLSIAEAQPKVIKAKERWKQHIKSNNKVSWIEEEIKELKDKTVHSAKQIPLDLEGSFKFRILKLAATIKEAQERARNEKSKGVVNDKKPHIKVRWFDNDVVPGAIPMSYDYNAFPKDRGEGYKKFVEKIKSKKKKKKVAQQQILPNPITGIQINDPLLSRALNLARQIAPNIVSRAEGSLYEGGKNIGITVEMDTGATTGGVAELQTYTLPDGTTQHQRRIGVNMMGTYASEMYQAMQSQPNIDGSNAELITAAYVLVHELAHHTSGAQLAMELEAELAANNFLQQAKQILVVR